MNNIIVTNGGHKRFMRAVSHFDDEDWLVKNSLFGINNLYFFLNIRNKIIYYYVVDRRSDSNRLLSDKDGKILAYAGRDKEFIERFQKEWKQSENFLKESMEDYQMGRFWG